MRSALKLLPLLIFTAVIGFRLGKRVVQNDVDDVFKGHVGVDFCDDDAVSVPVKHVRHSGQHDVVVVDEGNGDRSFGRRCHGPQITYLGVY